MASEKLRQREVHKYYQSWLDSSIGFDATPSTQLSRHHSDGSPLRISKDKALIAFAQLGCLRLDVKRSVVTLISTDEQYILAEATKTLSLISGDGDSNVQDEIWFGNASLPRSQGVSGDALAPPDYVAVGADNRTYVAPALVVDDMTTHEKYRSREYAGKGVTFYCGVPILTTSGVPIGVYTVTDDKPRKGLKPEELRFMHDMAATVMRHLDVVSNEGARFRGETMVLGLGKFISGARSLSDETGSSSMAHMNSSKSDLAASQPARLFKGMTITTANPGKLRTGVSEASGSTSPKRASMMVSGSKPDQPSIPSVLANSSGHVPTELHPSSQGANAGQESLSEMPSPGTTIVAETYSTSDSIFSRAAKILQECVAADGVLFFDAVSTNFAKRANFASSGFSFDRSSAETTQLDSSINGISGAQSPELRNSTSLLYSGGSEESDIGGSNENEKRMCKLLGHAVKASSQAVTGIDVLENVQMTERSLSRLVKLYPQGKLFSFHVDGGFSTSDGEHLTEDSCLTAESTSVMPGRVLIADKSKRIPRAIAEELERLVPHAQSIVWLPLWDFAKHRWSAGLFLWSRRIDRLVAAQDDLIYLKAFANSIMVEVARLDAARADTAKSTFIANISHELRTPLHGILGNLDILQDTKLTDFQQSLITAIEVCGRTLSDTIDHVLDYSKINQLSKYSKKRTKSTSALIPVLDNSGSLTTEEDFDIAAIVEEAVEAAYASHAFQSSGRTRLRASSFTGKQLPRSTASEKGNNVHTVVNLEYKNNWFVYSQPSAIRRVVTNLFGNALKYTDAGMIQVNLSSPRLARNINLRSSVPILLSVKDTGRGMSKDFVRNHAFVPFSQESQFSTGTGLGLSIVQQIVKSLGGKIELQSDQGVGTEIKVFLNLPASQHEEAARRSAMSPSFMPFHSTQSPVTIEFTSAKEGDLSYDSLGLRTVLSSLQIMARNWFNLRINDTQNSSHRTAKVVLYVTPPTTKELEQVTSSVSLGSKARIIVVALNTTEKATLMTAYANLGLSTTSYIDVISYPIAPRKLGQALSRCLGLEELKDVTEGIESTNQRDATINEASAPQVATVEPSEEDMNATETNELLEGPITPEAFGASNKTSPKKRLSFASAQLQQQKSTDQDPKSTLNRKSSATHPNIKEPANSQTTEPVPRPSTIMPRSISAPAPFLPSEDGSNSQSSIRVLLVDDNEINLNILKTCMRRARVSYEYAKDGLQASNVFQQAFHAQSGFTHVLMDISMPVMDGIQSTREIRDFERQQDSLQRVSSRKRASHSHDSARPEGTDSSSEPTHQSETSRALIIALSGIASEATQLEMLEAGADMFLPKPVKLRELLKVLGR